MTLEQKQIQVFNEYQNAKKVYLKQLIHMRFLQNANQNTENMQMIRNYIILMKYQDVIKKYKAENLN